MPASRNVLHMRQFVPLGTPAILGVILFLALDFQKDAIITGPEFFGHLCSLVPVQRVLNSLAFQFEF